MLFQELTQRGLIKDVTHQDALSTLLEKDAVSLYCGFDPTATSLHVGSLLPMVTLMRFSQAGHHPIALIGGATGAIGDPSGKTQERTMLQGDTLHTNREAITAQIEKITHCRTVDNLTWCQDINMLDFLRDIGKHFTVNHMLSKESVKNRIVRDGTGISFTEFSYMLLQAQDFLQLHNQHHCQVQIGGSDQWGNITAGCELIKKSCPDANVFGLTFPLLTKADGTKFGKSEGGNIWLDSALTSPFQFFQFWLKTTDADVYTLLRQLTFLTLAEIEGIEEEDKRGGKPLAQQILAEILTELVHGHEATKQAKQYSEWFFKGDFHKFPLDQLKSLTEGAVPHAIVEADTSVIDALIALQMVKSKTQARQAIEQNGISVNGEKINNLNSIVSGSNWLFNRFCVLKKGKRTLGIVEKIT
jgi:tyrosyl-tRNA synthetase